VEGGQGTTIQRKKGIGRQKAMEKKGKSEKKERTMKKGQEPGDKVQVDKLTGLF
jgi:hypothetical protein